MSASLDDVSRFGRNVRFLRKAAALVHAPYGENIQQIDAKIWHFLIFRAYPAIGEARIHEAPVSEVLGYLGYGSPRRLHASMERLAKAEITIDWVDETRSEHSLRAHYVSYDIGYGEDGVLKYSFDPILEACMATPTAFAQLSIVTLKKFRSKYAMKLYEIMALRERRYHKMWEPDLAEFRRQMGINERYARFDNLRQRVLQPSIDEVNEIAPFAVLLEVIRRGTGGAILKLRFRVVPRDQRTLVDGQPSARLRQARRRKEPDLFAPEKDIERRHLVTATALKKAEEFVGNDREAIERALEEWRGAMKGRRVRSPDQSFLAWLALKTYKATDKTDLLAGLDGDAMASFISAWQEGR